MAVALEVLDAADPPVVAVAPLPPEPVPVGALVATGTSLKVPLLQ